MGDLISRWLGLLQADAFKWIAAPGLLLVAALCGHWFGFGMALLVLASGTLLSVILLFWSSLQNLAGETPLTLEEALSLGAPSAEEEQKQAVLRALKDLEYERSVGKINEQDYQELSQRYRTEAKALLLLVDRNLGPALQKAEALLAQRLAADAPDDGSTPAEAASTSGVCANCQTHNDADAQFCKKCGSTLATAPETA